MARKKPQHPPSSSSSSSSDGDDQPTPAPSSQPPKKPSSKQPPQQPPSSSSESESETESSSSPSSSSSEEEDPRKQQVAQEDESDESDSSESDSPPPPSKKPDPPARTKPKSKSKPKAPAPPPSNPELEEAPAPKETPEKPKKSATAPPSEKKRKAPPKDEPNGPSASTKKLFERVWTADDELVLLRGLAEFHSLHGHDPSNASDAAALLDMLGDRLHGDFTPSQLISKIRHTKRKFATNLAREREGGADRVCSRPHEKEVYELSKKVWGNTIAPAPSEDGEEDPRRGRRRAKSGAVSTSPRKRRNSVAANGPVKEEGREEQFALLERATGLIVEEVGRDGVGSARCETLRRGLRMMPPEVVADFSEKWKELDLEEFRLWSRRVQLTLQILKSAEEALATGGS